jgi:hypothetical protein
MNNFFKSLKMKKKQEKYETLKKQRVFFFTMLNCKKKIIFISQCKLY